MNALDPGNEDEQGNAYLIITMNNYLFSFS